MNKLLIFLLSLCVTSLQGATITNWGAQLPTAVPASGDVILMQKGGVVYYFTPNQLATQLSTNANLTAGVSLPISSVQFNSNGVMQGSAGFVFTNGNFGIGTNAPQTKLHVNGGVILEDNFYDIRAFGAVEDPTVDNAAAIQSAITTVGLIGGGVVFVPAGRWLARSPAGAVVPSLAWTNSNVTLRGAGKDKSIIFNDRIATDGDGSMVIGFTVSIDNVTIQDIGFENRGNTYVAANAGAALLYFADGTRSFNNIRIERCSFLTSNRVGIAFGARITNYAVVDCYFDGTQEEAIYLAGVCSRGTILNNQMPMRGTPTNLSVGIAIRSALDLLVSGNRVENCGLYGILCRDNVNRRIQIVNNEVINGTTAGSCAIAVASGQDVLVSGNIVDGWPFGIDALFSVAATNITIQGNHVFGTTLTGIRVSGATAQGYNIQVNGNHVSQTGQGIRVAYMSNGPVHVAYNTIDRISSGADYGLLSTDNPAGVVNWGPNIIRNYPLFDTGSGWAAGTNLSFYGKVGLNTLFPTAELHVVGGIVQTNGGIWQTWSLGAPSAPATQGAVYWNDGTNICAVFRNAGGALSTNKLSMTAWP